MIDWHKLALAPGVERLGAILREDFGVWVGLLAPDGARIPLGSTTVTLKRPICEALVANGASAESGPGPNSCRASLEAWARQNPNEVVQGDCHAGLQALLVPVHRDGDVIGHVYVSGFLHGEEVAERVHRLKRMLSALEVEYSESWFDALPNLPLRKRDVVKELARTIAAEVGRLADELDEEDAESYGDMIGQSEPMLRLFKSLRKVARSNSTVLVQGENGTGKELIARAIHEQSRRRDQAFIVQNVAAIPADLIESELFGHKKGAFSGAHRDRVGLFEVANHGTFFLDEIGEMDLALQVKLLRVLQQGTFLPVGDNVFRKVDVRVICATNRDLKEEVKAGRFREDLYYRINVISLTAPPLRTRRDDVPLLARHFLAKACHRHDRPPKTLDEGAIRALMAHAWPGNVRELENEIERLVIMTGEEPVILEDDVRLRARRGGAFDDVELSQMALPDAVEKLERKMILESLKRTQWNKTQSARELGVSRRNLIRKVASYELEKHKS